MRLPVLARRLSWSAATGCFGCSVGAVVADRLPAIPPGRDSGWYVIQYHLMEGVGDVHNCE